MKFVIFGQGVDAAAGAIGPGLWCGLCRALVQRGHRIVFFEREMPGPAVRRGSAPRSDGEVWVYQDFNKAGYQARRHLADADVAIVASNCHDVGTIVALVLDSAVSVRAFYELEAAETLEQLRGARDGAEIYGARGLRDFDLVLSRTGGRVLDELRQRLGARRVATLYGSVDPEMVFRVAPVERFAADCSYAGRLSADMHATFEELFIAAAMRRRKRRFVVADIGRAGILAAPENLVGLGRLEPAEHLELYASSRLMLNITPRATREFGFCPTARMFEAAACGTPVVSDRWHGMNLFFEPGSEIIVASTRAEVEAAMDLTDEALAAIGRRARERVLDEHTTAHRATHLETIVENTINAGGEAELALARDTIDESLTEPSKIEV